MSALQIHHKYLFLYGLALVVIAVIIPAFAGVFDKQIFLPYLNEMISHPPIIILFVTLLLISSMTFALIGATHGNFWMRFVTTISVAILLYFMSWTIFAANYILPVLFILIGYVLWRGSHPIRGYPTMKDLMIIGFAILTIWGMVLLLGVIFLDTGAMVTLYMVNTQVIAFAAFLPMPLILLSGVDLANVTDKVVEKMTTFVISGGKQVVLVTLLSTSVVKLGFNLWKIEGHSFSSLVFSILFLLIFIYLVKLIPKPLLEFEPKFKHWIMIIGLIQPVPVGIAMVLIMLGMPLSTDYSSALNTVVIGPICLGLAGILTFYLRRRPFSILLAVITVWTLLTFTLKIMGNQFFGFTFDGLTLWSLDGLTSFIFIIWSIVLLYQKRSSPLVSTALKFSFFLSCCFVIDQLLNNQVAIAELYTLFQVLTFLVIHQFISRPKRAWWIQVVPWTLIAVMFAHNVWSGIFPETILNTVKIALLTIALLWDILMSEEKIRGEKVIGPQQPGLLFIYLGYVIWTVAQVVYAKSGKGAAIFDWEPILITGFLFIGIPWVLYLLLREVKEKLTDVKKI